MTTLVKTNKEIQIMKDGGKKLAHIFTKLSQLIKVGTNLLDIEKKAVQLIKAEGGEPAFARVPGYHWATCLNVNEEIVHGIPKDYKIKDSDLVNLDMGLYYQGFNTDMSATFYVENLNTPPRCLKRLLGDGGKKKTINRFLEAGKKALKEAKKQARAGNRVGNISLKIQEIIEAFGFNCARNLTGHGIGKKLHEPPNIPCFLKKGLNKTQLLRTGMALAIEVIYTQGRPDLIVDPKDKWTIKTQDGKISAVFEETVVVTKDLPLVLTRLP